LRVVQLLSDLLPNPVGLQLVGWKLNPAQALIALHLRSPQTSFYCPCCRAPTERVHSRYQRTLADLPWGHWSVRLGVGVRKLFCDNPRCGRRIFTERLPGVAAPWARKTARLCHRLTAIAAALGGAAGARLSSTLGMPTARNTLLRLIRAAPLPPDPVPVALGVDDWAYRKRHTYGTVLIDLERHRPIALWDGREADALAQWLREHPGVEVVARDRAGAYAEGTRRGAPHALQVADRFHLLQNLAEALERAFSAHAAELRATESASPVPTPEEAVRPVAPLPEAGARAKAVEARERRLARYQQVWALHRQGWSGAQIARRLGFGRHTVLRYLKQEHFPERQRPRKRGRNLLDPWKPVILERWNGGCRHSRRLFFELRQQGYRGSYPTLARYTRRLRQAQAGIAPEPRARKHPPARVIDSPKRPLTARSAAWLVLRHPEERDAEDTEQLNRLRRQPGALAEAVALAEEFATLVRTRDPERLEPWLARAQDSPLSAFQSFAKKLDADREAVRAAVSLPWSNGPVEGQITRLKMLKRQMYGRANLDLLNRRFRFAA
jgi:transposase